MATIEMRILIAGGMSTGKSEFIKFFPTTRETVAISGANDTFAIEADVFRFKNEVEQNFQLTFVEMPSDVFARVERQKFNVGETLAYCSNNDFVVVLFDWSQQARPQLLCFVENIKKRSPNLQASAIAGNKLAYAPPNHSVITRYENYISSDTDGSKYGACRCFNVECVETAFYEKYGPNKVMDFFLSHCSDTGNDSSMNTAIFSIGKWPVPTLDSQAIVLKPVCEDARVRKSLKTFFFKPGSSTTIGRSGLFHDLTGASNNPNSAGISKVHITFERPEGGTEVLTIKRLSAIHQVTIENMGYDCDYISHKSSGTLELGGTVELIRDCDDFKYQLVTFHDYINEGSIDAPPLALESHIKDIIKNLQLTVDLQSRRLVFITKIAEDIQASLQERVQFPAAGATILEDVEEDETGPSEDDEDEYNAIFQDTQQI